MGPILAALFAQLLPIIIALIEKWINKQGLDPDIGWLALRKELKGKDFKAFAASQK